MCLGVPGRVIRIQGKLATVDFWGARRNVRIDSVPEQIGVGDYVIDHAGSIERKIAPEDVADTLALYEVILTEAGCDPIATDIVAELEAMGELIEEEVLA
jgi:hydrogenase expression/formation protein HypC